MPSDGSVNPIDLTQALAKGARFFGATLREQIEVTEVLTNGEKITGVRTSEGIIASEYVVNCGGMWARELARPHTTTINHIFGGNYAFASPNASYFFTIG